MSPGQEELKIWNTLHIARCQMGVPHSALLKNFTTSLCFLHFHLITWQVGKMVFQTNHSIQGAVFQFTEFLWSWNMSLRFKLLRPTDEFRSEIIHHMVTKLSDLGSVLISTYWAPAVYLAVSWALWLTKKKCWPWNLSSRCQLSI